MRAFQRVGPWLLMCGALAACDSSSKNPVADASTIGADATTDAASPQASSRVKGRVFDATTGRPLEKAELKAEDGASAKSDAQGNFELEVKNPESALKVTRPSYASSNKSAPTDGGYVEVFLKGVDKTVDFNSEDGVSVGLKSGASVELPAGAVRDAEGKQVTGPVTMEVTEVEGEKRMQASALPGDAQARNAEGKAGRASVYSALEIRIHDRSGRNLTVGPEANVTADLPIREKNAPDDRSVFSFDEQHGEWVEEGKAKRVTKDGRDVYRAEVKHLSWWSYAEFSSKLTCIRACVKDQAKRPVRGAQIWIVGTSQPGVASVFAGADGCAATDIVAGSKVVLFAQSEAGSSVPKSLATTSAIHLVKNGVNACQSAGTLVIEPVASSSCAHGFDECGDACVDLASDSEHCGDCRTACESSAACVLAQCEGPDALADAGMMTAPDAGEVMVTDAGMSFPDAGMPTQDAGFTPFDAGLASDAGPTPDGGTAPAGAPVAWYQFEETSGTVVDSSGNGLNGTPQASGVTQGVAGKIGKGINFSGGYVVVPASTLLDFSTASTIEFWLNLANTTAIGSIVSRGTGNNDDNTLVNTSCGNMQAIYSRASPSGTTSSGSFCNLLAANKWQHVAIVNDGTSLLVYVDGSLQETDPGGQLGPITSDLWIGKRDNIFPLAGSLDELKWWNVARSIAEICVDAGGTWGGESCALP